MAKAKYYIRMDSYWQNSPDTFFGPYATREQAAAAVDASTCARADLGQSASDVKNQARCLGVLNATQARKAGMTERNTITAQDEMPGTVAELNEIRESYLYW